MISSNYKELIEKCKKKWDVIEGVKDPVIEHFEEVIDSFIEQFDDEEKRIVIDLIEKFEYYGEIKGSNCLSEQYNKLLKNNLLNIEETIILPIEKDDKISSSELYTACFLLKNRINYNQKVSIKDEESFKEWRKTIKRIIIIDDFCGSGNTLKDFIEKHKNKFEGLEIYYIVIHAMKEGKKLLERLKYDNIRVYIINCMESSKAFAENDEYREKFSEISKKFGIKKGDIFGYENTEALVAFYSNTPNNTLGIFRNGNEKNKFPIFPRKYDSIHGWKRNKEEVKKRANERYGV